MIDGIVVLGESYLKNNDPNAYMTNSYLALLGIFIICIIGIFLVYNKSRILVALGICMIIVSLLSIGFLSFYRHSDSDIKAYKVTISEDVRFVDFNNKYEVISKEDNIYTIIDKK